MFRTEKPGFFWTLLWYCLQICSPSFSQMEANRDDDNLLDYNTALYILVGIVVFFGLASILFLVATICVCVESVKRKKHSKCTGKLDNVKSVPFATNMTAISTSEKQSSSGLFFANKSAVDDIQENNLSFNLEKDSVVPDLVMPNPAAFEEYQSSPHCEDNNTLSNMHREMSSQVDF